MKLEEAIELIKDGDTVGIVGAGLVMFPEYLARGIEDSFLKYGKPKHLTLVSGCGHGNWDHTGDSRFAHKGLLKRAIVTHPDSAPALRDKLIRGEIEGYLLPQGVLNQLYRCIAARQPGMITKVGLDTFMDPRRGGGKLNELAKDDLIQIMDLNGEEWLFYKAFPINVALIRGTTADLKGNITIEKEAVEMEVLALSLAAKGSKGKVIAQVERVTECGRLNPKDVVVPGILVDAIVIAENPQETHRQTAGSYYNPYFSGEVRMPKELIFKTKERIVLTPEYIVGRRAALELFPGAVVNIGIGIPAFVSEVVFDEGKMDEITLTVELGVIGGAPAGHPDFGVSFNPEAIISHSHMFDFYHGGGLDISFVGAAQIDSEGNVNVSKFAGRLSGIGGFIDITQSTKKIVFCTLFTAGGLKVEIAEGRVNIVSEGKIKKFVKQVEHVSFSGRRARAEQKEVIIVTERCVFKLEKDGLTLTEVAPGVDVKRHIIEQMDFEPKIAANLKQMNKKIFRAERMGLFN